MQINNLVVSEGNVGVCLVNVETEYCKTRINISEFQCVLFLYSRCLSTSPFDFSDTINCNFQLILLVSFIKYATHTE